MSAIRDGKTPKRAGRTRTVTGVTDDEPGHWWMQRIDQIGRNRPRSDSGTLGSTRFTHSSGFEAVSRSLKYDRF